MKKLIFTPNATYPDGSYDMGAVEFTSEEMAKVWMHAIRRWLERPEGPPFPFCIAYPGTFEDWPAKEPAAE